jgi:hypothetical protein
LRDPLTERSHQEISAELVDTAAAVEADDARCGRGGKRTIARAC